MCQLCVLLLTSVVVDSDDSLCFLFCHYLCFFDCLLMQDSKCLTVGPKMDDGDTSKLWLWDCLPGLKDQHFLVTRSNPSILEQLAEL